MNSRPDSDKCEWFRPIGRRYLQSLRCGCGTGSLCTDCASLDLKADYSATQVKLAAEFSLPTAPVNLGHFGYSHSGRVRLALALPSIAVRPLGGCPFSTQSSSAEKLSNFALKTPNP